MAKKKISGEVPAEELETGNETTAAAEATGDEAPSKAKGAPRARKWNYGIIPEATLSLNEDKTAPKGAIAGFNALTDGSMTVEQFGAAVEDWRHELRVLMRAGIVTLTHADGSTFPVQYDHEAAAAAREAKAALKKAKEEKAKAGEEVPA